MASVTIVMSGDDARLQAAHDRLLRAQEKALENYQKNVNKSKEAQAQAQADIEARKKAVEAEKQRLATIEKGQQLIANQRDAQQKYNDEVKEAKRLLDAKAISDDDYKKRLQVLSTQLREATGETQRHNDAMKRGEEITKAVQNPTEKYRAKLAELNKLFKEGAIDVETFSRASKQASAELSGSSDLIGTLGSKIGGIAAAYVSIQGAVGVYNGLLEEQNRLQDTALQKATALASAQSDAVKNLIGLNYVESGAVLKEAEAISTRTGFAGRDVITQALGAAVSAGATVEQAVSAVENAAKINKQTPGQLGATAAGAVDISRATGLTDAQQNMGFALDVASVSRVEKFDKLQTALAKTLISGVASMPSVSKEEASKQQAAFFAATNQLANDLQGESTATANVQFGAYLAKFFDTAGLKDVSAKIQALESKAEVTPKEALLIQNAEKKVATTRGAEQEKAQVMLNDLKARATLTAAEADKLKNLREQQSQFSGIQDPGDLLGRIVAIQNADEETRARFFEKMPGEAVFKKPMELIATKGTEAFEMFRKNYAENIDFNPQTFLDAESRIKSSTPALALGESVATAESNATAFDSNNSNAAIAQLRKIREQTFERARAPGFMGVVQSMEEGFMRRTGIEASSETSVESSAKFTRKMLQGTRRDLEGDTSPRADDARALIDANLRLVDKVLQDLDKFANAANAQVQAAATMQQAADQMTQTPSIAPAARAQAATAGR